MATSVKRARSRPRGRDEVVDAVLDAAQRLFARSGPAAVSLRDIAAEAKVTYSLINRHFGTKDDLLQALLDRYASRWQPGDAASLTAAVESLFGTTVQQGEYLRLLAWSLLGGSGAGDLGAKATLDQLVPLARQSTDDDATAVANTAAALALTFGWRFFHPFIIEALRVSKGESAALHSSIGERLRLFDGADSDAQ